MISALLRRPGLREAAILAGIAIAVTAATMGIFRYMPFLGTAERWIADYRIATLLAPEPQHPDIVIAALNEDTLEMFPYRSPIDRKFIADLLQLLAARGARAVFLDVLIDQPTEEEKDDLLKETLDGLTMPIIVSYGRQEELLTDNQVEYLEEFVKPELRGFANLVKDGFDGTVRWIYPGRALPDGTFLRGTAPRMIERLGGTPVETTLPLAYRGRPDLETPAFRSFPAHTIGVLPPAWIKDKIVMIGADQTFTDRHRTPFATAHEGHDGILPGVVIHAHAIAQLLDGRQAPDLGYVQSAAIIGLLAIAGVLLVRIELHVALRLALAGGAVVLLWVGGFVLFRYENVLMPLLQPMLGLGLAMWMTDVHAGRQERQQKKFISQVFSKYVSRDLLDEILKDPARLSLDATRKEMSLLFTDVQGFTTISERMEPAALANLLNAYLDGACDEVFRYGGTVNQFTGDAIYAMFNAPKDQPDHAERALRCAMAIDEFSERFVAEQAAKGVEFGLTRIGVHTAMASVGNFGSRERFEFKALGDAVNTASRLEGLNKYFSTRVLVSGGCAKHCNGQEFRSIGAIVVKGRAHPIDVLEPLSPERATSSLVLRYREAYVAMEQNDPAALSLFEKLHADFPDDGPTEFHLDRLRRGETGSRVVMEEK